jgi:hypothetical protein
MSYSIGGITVINNNKVVIVGSGTTDPTSPATGTIFFNTTSGQLKGWDGSTWVALLG